MELARQVTWSETRVELFHYRTKDKLEVDVVLENRQGQVVGVEVKAASTVGRDNFSGLRHLAQRLGDDFLVGLVMYTGQQTLFRPAAEGHARQRDLGSTADLTHATPHASGPRGHGDLSAVRGPLGADAD